MTVVGEVALFTSDVAATVAFYRDLVGSAPVAEWPGGAIFVVGETKLLIHERGAAMENGPPNEDHFALGVADVAAACATLREQGHVLLVEPRDYAWGPSAYLRDPDGRLVELAQG